MNFTCPHCGKQNDEAECMSNPGTLPEPGDISICISCGEWGIFTETALRRPDLTELFQIMHDPDNVKIKKCWKEMNKIRSRSK